VLHPVFKSNQTDPLSRIAYYVSLILNPTTLGLLAAAAFSVLFGRSTSEIFRLFAVSFTFGVLLPFLYLVYLRRNDRIESLDVPIRTQRTVPYLLASLSYVVGLAILILISAPEALVALMACYLGNTLFVAAVNAYWKISAHAMGVGAVVTGFGFAVSPYYYIGLILLPVVSWSRIKLDMHSRGQVIAGSILSVILTALQFLLVYTVYQP
jgi:membrane-associated phospholipid phosphatase